MRRSPLLALAALTSFVVATRALSQDSTKTPAPAAAPAADSGRFDIRFRASPVANLVYQLDCLAGERACTASAFRDLWHDTLGWTAADDSALEAWGQVRARYRADVELASAVPQMAFPYNYPVSEARVDLPSKLRIAALMADSLPQYGDFLALLMAPADRAAALRVLEQFRPRFDGWWAGGIAGRLRAAGEALRDTMAHRELPALFARLAAFYEADLPARPRLDFDLIALPTSTGGAFARQEENHAIVEVPDGDAPETRLGVIVHEFCHYLYGSAPLTRQAALLRAFLDSGDPDPTSLYALLNEAVATAIGNGIVQKSLLPEEQYSAYFAQERSFYNDPYIDRAAKALVPAVDRRLHEGGTLFDGFDAEYRELVGRALGPMEADPKLALKSLAVYATSDSLASVERELDEAVRPGSKMSGRAGFERYPALTGVILARTRDLGTLERWSRTLPPTELEAIRREAARTASFAYGVRRPKGAMLYVLVGRTPDDVSSALRALVSSRESFVGVKGTMVMER